MKHKPTYPPLQTCRKCGCGVPDLKKHTCAPRPDAVKRQVFTVEQEQRIQEMIDKQVSQSLLAGLRLALGDDK